MYKVYVIDPFTGHIHNPNGTTFLKDRDEPYFEKPISSLNRAKIYSRALVRRYPNLSCEIYDENMGRV